MNVCVEQTASETENEKLLGEADYGFANVAGKFFGLGIFEMQA